MAGKFHNVLARKRVRAAENRRYHFVEDFAVCINDASQVQRVACHFRQIGTFP